MKYFVLVCSGLASDPVEELGGRTPLEVAKTPAIDALAKKARMGITNFVPTNLKPSSDTACMALLGYDPLEFYTGVAPLEASAADLRQSDQEVVFRCDLVTVFEDKMVDATAGGISAKESEILIRELAGKCSNQKFKFYSGGGYKNILIMRDSEMVEDLDELECVPPFEILGQKIQKHLPKGKAEAIARDLMEMSKTVLENHEINRVRIDLKENPANMIWLWGQGKRPKLPEFKRLRNLEGNILSNADDVRGIGKSVGLVPAAEIDVADKDFVFVYWGGERAPKKGVDLKTRIRRIEEFDSAVVEKVLKKYEEAPDGCRVLVAGDCLWPLGKKTPAHGPVPFFMAGAGIAAEAQALFNEKNCSQSKSSIESGHELLSLFLKS